MRIVKIQTVGLITTLLLSVFVVFTLNTPAYAVSDPTCKSEKFLGLPAWYKYLEMKRDATGRCSPILGGNSADTETRVNSILPIGLAILEMMLRISSLVAVAMIFFSGFRYITSQGNPEAAASARKTAINALIGLVIVVLATALVSFIGNSLLEAAPPLP